MGRIVISGDFLDKKITGIQRIAREILTELDKIIEKDEIELVIPKNIKEVPRYDNIKVVRIHSDNGNRHLWIQLWLPLYCICNKKISVNLCNETSVMKPDITIIHDIHYKIYKNDFKSLTQKINRFIVLLIYHSAIVRGKILITDSKFSKNEIIKHYKVSDKNIRILYAGWQHMDRILEDESIFSEVSVIKKGQYYFSLGSLSKKKNTEWILKYAKKHPSEIFVIAGANIIISDGNMESMIQSLPNVIFLGYISDEKIKTLMRYCKAFIFPSIYEGFGIPPLEALSAGAKIILANSSCLPEVYEDYAYYIDPFNTDIDLEKLLENKVEEDRSILDKYTWKKSAQQLYKIVKGYN